MILRTMEQHELIVGITVGSILLAFGLVPGLFDGVAAGVMQAMRNFRESLSSNWPAAPTRRAEYERLHRPFWLAGVGALLMAITVLDYLSK
jgi:hypothetical protein